MRPTWGSRHAIDFHLHWSLFLTLKTTTTTTVHSMQHTWSQHTIWGHDFHSGLAPNMKEKPLLRGPALRFTNSSTCLTNALTSVALTGKHWFFRKLSSSLSSLLLILLFQFLQTLWYLMMRTILQTCNFKIIQKNYTV